MSGVAIITGGASGMGYGVAKSLAAKGWHIHIADLNEEAAKRTAAEISGSYSQTNVADYESLRRTFDQVFAQHGELNFVFANAGVGELQDFYAATSDEDILSPPPELDKLIDINLKSVISTTYLAQHYMRKNKEKGNACIVINASVAGIYPVPFNPIYAASKHGVVGWARSISKHFFEKDGIRVNTICPGNVRTAFFQPEVSAVFKMEWIEVPQVAKVVEMLLLDKSWQGKVCEIAPSAHYFIETPAYQNDNVRLNLEGTTLEEFGR